MSIMEGVKCKIKILNGLKRDEMRLMSELNSISPLNITDFHMSADTASIRLGSVAELETLLKPEALAKLAELHLRIIPHGSHKANKTVFIPNPRHFMITTKSCDMLKLINENNEGLSAVECGIITSNEDRSKKYLKITFSSPDQAKEAQDNGLHIGHYTVLPQFVFPEVYAPTPQCYRCLSLEHVTRSCQAPTPKCSICAGNHKYTSCNNKTKVCCLLCGGNHIAISHKCPVKRNKAKELRDARIQQEASNTRNPVQPIPTAADFPHPPASRHAPRAPAQPPQPPPNAWSQHSSAQGHQDQTPTTSTHASTPQNDIPAEPRRPPTSTHRLLITSLREEGAIVRSN